MKNKFFQGESREFFDVQFLLLAAIVGLASAGFTYAVNFAEKFCHDFYTSYGLLTYIYIPAMFVFIVWMLKKYFPYSDGSGLPQGYAVDIFDNERLQNTYSLRTAIGKVFLTFMGIASGASLGKEGPTIQICASLFAQMRDISDKKRRLLIKLGAGVGVAAAFNAPLGGMIFAIEEYIRKISTKIAILLVGATLIAVFVCDSFTSHAPYLGYINRNLLQHDGSIIVVGILVGFACGLCGALFTWLMVLVSVNKKLAINRWRKKHYLLNALIFGLLVAFIGHLTGGLSFGNGTSTTRYFLDNDIQAPWYYAIGKFFGAISSVSAGVPGGYFSTALSIGAGIGDLLHHFFTDVPLVQIYLLGMAAFLAAITQSPITAVVMVVEMSNSSEFSLPILLSAFVASIISEQFGDGVYHQQVLNYIDPARYNETR